MFEDMLDIVRQPRRTFRPNEIMSLSYKKIQQNPIKYNKLHNMLYSHVYVT